MSTKDSIKSKIREIESLLLRKNEKYGDAALTPSKVFSKCNASTGLRVRIDDKLKRIQTSGEVGIDEDTLLDLTGYLILLMIAKDNEGNGVQKRVRQGGGTSYTVNHCSPQDSDGEEQGADF